MSTNETASPMPVAVSQTYWDMAVPLVVDGLTLMALPWLLPAVAPWLQTGRPLNAAVIISIFVFFWLSVFMLKRLAAAPEAVGQRTWLPDWLFTSRVQVILGVVFALALMTGLAHQIGYFDSIFLVDDRELGAGESASFFVLIPGTWLAMTLLYILPLASIPRDRLARSSSWYYLVLLLALLGVNLMLVTAVAELYTLHHLIMRGAGFSVAWLLGSFLLLALLFAPARLWYWWKVPRPLPLFSFGCVLLYAASLIAWA